MGQCPIHLLAVLVEYDIGEVVVFVDDEIELVSFFGCLRIDQVQLAARRGCILHPLHKSVAVILAVALDETVEDDVAVVIEIFPQHIDVSPYP